MRTSPLGSCTLIRYTGAHGRGAPNVLVGIGQGSGEERNQVLRRRAPLRQPRVRLSLETRPGLEASWLGSRSHAVTWDLFRTGPGSTVEPWIPTVER